MALTKVIGDGVGVLTTADEGKLKIQTGTTSASYLSFADGDNNRGYVKYDHNNDSLELGVAGESHFNINNAHILTMDKQPAFMVHPATTQSNLAITSNVTIVFGTERFDNNADFASNTFTAPVTGKYQFNANIRYDDADNAANYIQLVLKTSNKTYPITYDLGPLGSDPNYWMFNINILADMDASDTAYLYFYQEAGSQTADVTGDSFFSGYLVC
jgi:hypothetical protein